MEAIFFGVTGGVLWLLEALFVDESYVARRMGMVGQGLWRSVAVFFWYRVFSTGSLLVGKNIVAAEDEGRWRTCRVV